MDISNLFNPGIYKITCLKNNKIYIGQSSNILSRLDKHVDNLENNRHDCFQLQKDFNNFGKQYFKFETLKFGIKYNDENFRKEQEILLIKTILKENSYNIVDITNSSSARSVLIKGKIYNSLNKAAIQLNESRTNLVRKCLNKNNLDYKFIKQTSKLKYRFNKPSSCIINGIFYNSLNKAAKAFNVNHSAIKYRILSDKFPNYKYFNEIDRSNDYSDRK